jgi:putative endonuclease
MIRVFTSKSQQIGELGESLAARWLKKENFSIVERNYTLRHGEVDIIAKKDGKLYFFEVKSSFWKKNVSYETYNPAQNMHPKKIEKFIKAVDTYILQRKVSCETCIQLISVLIDQENKTSKVEVLDI